MGGTNVSFIDRGDTQRRRFRIEPALSLVPLARALRRAADRPLHGRLVVEVEVAGRETEHFERLDDRGAVLREHRAGEPVRRKSSLPPGSRRRSRRRTRTAQKGPEVLGGEDLVCRVVGLHHSRADEVVSLSSAMPPARVSTPASPRTRSRTSLSRSNERWPMTAPMKLEKSLTAPIDKAIDSLRKSSRSRDYNARVGGELVSARASQPARLGGVLVLEAARRRQIEGQGPHVKQVLTRITYAGSASGPAGSRVAGSW